jgi:hypothetical protein
VLPRTASLAPPPSQNAIVRRTSRVTQPPALALPSCQVLLAIRSFSGCKSSREGKDYAAQAKELNQKGLDKQEDGFNNQLDNAIGEAKELQARTPWHREGSDQPPVKRRRSAGAMTKGISVCTSLSACTNRLQ